MGATTKHLQDKLNMANKTVADINKDYKNLLDKFTEISAENYALKASQTLTVQEQQPLVVNHYHNCVINK
jgi:hypothetical protein